MAIYRVLRPLSLGSEVIEKRSLVPGSRFKPETLELLEAQGNLSRISAPPLEVLPGWTDRAVKLQKVGITGAEEFLEADLAVLARKMRRRETTLQGWREELLIWLN